MRSLTCGSLQHFSRHYYCDIIRLLSSHWCVAYDHMPPLFMPCCSSIKHTVINWHSIRAMMQWDVIRTEAHFIGSSDLYNSLVLTSCRWLTQFVTMHAGAAILGFVVLVLLLCRCCAHLLCELSCDARHSLPHRDLLSQHPRGSVLRSQHTGKYIQCDISKVITSFRSKVK